MFGRETTKYTVIYGVYIYIYIYIYMVLANPNHLPLIQPEMGLTEVKDVPNLMQNMPAP